MDTSRHIELVAIDPIGLAIAIKNTHIGEIVKPIFKNTGSN